MRKSGSLMGASRMNNNPRITIQSIPECHVRISSSCDGYGAGLKYRVKCDCGWYRVGKYEREIYAVCEATKHLKTMGYEPSESEAGDE